MKQTKIRYRKTILDETEMELLKESVLRLQPDRRILHWPKPMCDFCGSTDHLVCVYHASKTFTGLEMEVKRWAACEACEKLVDDNDWDTLVEQVATLAQSMIRAERPLCLLAAKKVMDEFLEIAIED